MTKKYRPIHCDLHDHVELACIYRYRIRVATNDARIITGTAITTRTDRAKQEWLLVEEEGGETSIRLDRIRSIEPLTPGARFSKIQFQ